MTISDRETTPILGLRNICKDFVKPSSDALHVLKGIQLTIREDQILGLVGRSGSGKSTLLRIAGGLMKPTSGEVFYWGNPLASPAAGTPLSFRPSSCYRG